MDTRECEGARKSKKQTKVDYLIRQRANSLSEVNKRKRDIVDISKSAAKEEFLGKSKKPLKIVSSPIKIQETTTMEEKMEKLTKIVMELR